jgi:hypothetical protein
MGVQRKLVLAGAVAALLALVFFVAFQMVPVERLAICDEKGRALDRINLPDGTFDYVFVHSVHLTPVIERYRVERTASPWGAALHLYELRYQSPGVGMPSDAEGGYRLEGGFFVLSMDRTFARIPLRVSIVAGHGIVVGGQFHPFTRWAPQRGALVLRGETGWALRLRRYST